jgi:hypothetical protein
VAKQPAPFMKPIENPFEDRHRLLAAKRSLLTNIHTLVNEEERLLRAFGGQILPRIAIGGVSTPAAHSTHSLRSQTSRSSASSAIATFYSASDDGRFCATSRVPPCVPRLRLAQDVLAASKRK